MVLAELGYDGKLEVFNVTINYCSGIFRDIDG